jgi:PAS domain S-box-containing protein
MARTDVTSGNLEGFTGGLGLNQVFAQAPVGMAVLQGREMRYAFANPKYQEIIGRRDPVGKLLVEMFPDLAGSEIQTILECVFDTAAPFASTDTHIRFDSHGTGAIDNFYDLSFHPLIDAGGTPSGILVVAVDVTERHAFMERERLLTAAEAARAEAEAGRARLAELFRLAPALIAVLRGPDHAFDLANDEYHRVVGHRDLIGKPLLDALPELRGQDFTELLDGVLATGKSFEGREVAVGLAPAIGAPLEERYVNFVYQPLAEPDGHRSGVLVFGVDVTEQVHARRALVASEARYRSLAEAVPVQVWTTRPDGHLEFVSEQTAAYLGVSVEEVLATGWTPYIHAEDRVPALAAWSHAVTSGLPHQSEFRLRAGASGAYRWHLARAVPERDASGVVVAWAGSNTDVEDERSARAGAEEANRVKSEFLTVMSHELRTPLNAIGGYAELLEMGIRGPVTAEQRTDLERIQRSQRHLLGLINGVLTYAKLDAGTIQYGKEDVSLDDVLLTCEALTVPLVRAKGLELSYSPVEPQLMARGDREKVQQIVINLVSNAINFTEPGGRVTVSCERMGTDRVTVRVTDTGRGIAAEQLDRIFHPFVQVNPTLTRTQQGTGLGLAISREFARGMGGALTVESEPDVGSSFTLTLPRDEPDGPDTYRRGAPGSV